MGIADEYRAAIEEQAHGCSSSNQHAAATGVRSTPPECRFVVCSCNDAQRGVTSPLAGPGRPTTGRSAAAGAAGGPLDRLWLAPASPLPDHWGERPIVFPDSWVVTTRAVPLASIG
jgi:hypothetical protein